MNNYLCMHCLNASVKFIKASGTYSDPYWICEKCDSTYPEWQYPQAIVQFVQNERKNNDR